MITLIILIFVLGYMAIAFEHNTSINKAAPALVTGVLCWTVYITMSGKDYHVVTHELYGYMGEISGVLFFLLGAMTIVEIIDVHEGFEVFTRRIKTKKISKLMVLLCIITFFLSSVLDNLATTIVVVSIIRKLVKKPENRMFMVGMVVIAANAGGAWSPIGDVTTTMLWIGGQVTAPVIVTKIILPSMICLAVPLLLSYKRAAGLVETPIPSSSLKEDGTHKKLVTPKESRIILALGIFTLVSVPIFKTVTHLPPFMGILLGLGFLWIITEAMHRGKYNEVKDPLSLTSIIRRVDVPSVLFFFGILVSISSLQATGVLEDLARLLEDKVGNYYVIAMTLGLFSAIVDNVPLVAASMGMYDLATFPTDHYFWQFIAYCAGTGGSSLIIGSAAGVAAMGMEKISFTYYFKHISWLAVVGYFSGAFFYIFMHEIGWM